jgi:hypothetical protein
MAMAFHERRELEEQPPAKVKGERSSVPTRSRTATARKLEEVAEPEPPVIVRARNRGAQAEIALTKTNQEVAQREQTRVRDIEELQTKRDELIERLDKGAARIEDARAKGKDVQEWEDYWIQLLRHYEQICDKLRELDRV